MADGTIEKFHPPLLSRVLVSTSEDLFSLFLQVVVGSINLAENAICLSQAP